MSTAVTEVDTLIQDDGKKRHSYNGNSFLKVKSKNPEPTPPASGSSTVFDNDDDHSRGKGCCTIC